jgi:hypothetical protein
MTRHGKGPTMKHIDLVVVLSPESRAAGTSIVAATKRRLREDFLPASI